MSSFFKSLEPSERRNMFLYILGIMVYKFALDSVMHSFNRALGKRTDKSRQNSVWAMTLFFNILMQCFGSLMGSPLVYRFKINHVLAFAAVSFGILVVIFPILHHFVFKLYFDDSHSVYIVAGLVFLYGLAGFCQGVVELIRRVIPFHIVGLRTDRLRSFDSCVHVFYEVAGVSGAFTTHYIITTYSDQISELGLLLFPFCSVFCAILWSCVSSNPSVSQSETSDIADNEKIVSQCEENVCKGSKSISDKNETNSETFKHRPPQKPTSPTNTGFSGFLRDVKKIFSAFVFSVKNGFLLVVRNRALIWLIPAYSLPLLLHRYLEGILLKQHALVKHGNEDIRLQLVAGSNFGEFCGALVVLIKEDMFPSPLPWLRLDALTLFLTWILTIVPSVQQNELESSPKVRSFVFFLCSCISFGFASGDVSISAYVQAVVGKIDGRKTRTLPLGSVMAFLYVCYILLFGAISIPINLIADAGEKTSEERNEFMKTIIMWTCVVYSICGVIVLLASLIPRGAFKFNPRLNIKEIVLNVPSSMLKNDASESVVPSSRSAKKNQAKNTNNNEVIGDKI